MVDEKALTEAFKKEVAIHEPVIAEQNFSPLGETEWWSMTLGWALAKGLNPEEAAGFASFIRYKTSLG